MIRLISCLGFWLTIGLFVVFGYALGGEYDPMNGREVCSTDLQSTTPAAADRNESLGENESNAKETDCIGNPVAPVDDLAQSINRVGGDPVYAPSIILTFTGDPPRVGLCPRAIPVWR